MISRSDLPWVVVGTGGHGRQVLRLLERLGHPVLGFLDEAPERQGRVLAGQPVLGDLDWLGTWGRPMAVALAIGDGRVRERMHGQLTATGWPLTFPPLIHPAADLGPRVRVGDGTVVEAGCILTCDIEVGAFVLLNVGCRLGHDVQVGDYATVAGSSHLTGAVQCGPLADLGVGTVTVPGVKLGEGARTGAGAVITRDVAPWTTVVGVPARPLPGRETAR